MAHSFLFGIDAQMITRHRKTGDESDGFTKKIYQDFEEMVEAAGIEPASKGCDQ